MLENAIKIKIPEACDPVRPGRVGVGCQHRMLARRSRGIAFEVRCEDTAVKKASCGSWDNARQLTRCY